MSTVGKISALLATHASVDLALARLHMSSKERRAIPVSKTLTVGEPRKRANKHLVDLFIGIAHANDLQIDVAHNSTYVIVYGMPSDIEVSEVDFNSLATKMF